MSFIFASKKGNGVLRHFKDSFIDFTFLSKWRRKIGVHWWMAESCQGQSGVMVNFRQGNLISMSWLKFFDTIIHNNHFITFIHLKAVWQSPWQNKNAFLWRKMTPYIRCLTHNLSGPSILTPANFSFFDMRCVHGTFFHRKIYRVVHIRRLRRLGFVSRIKSSIKSYWLYCMPCLN